MGDLGGCSLAVLVCRDKKDVKTWLRLVMVFSSGSSSVVRFAPEAVKSDNWIKCRENSTLLSLSCIKQGQRGDEWTKTAPALAAGDASPRESMS